MAEDFVPAEPDEGPPSPAPAPSAFADFEARLAEHLTFDEGKQRMLETLLA